MLTLIGCSCDDDVEIVAGAAPPIGPWLGQQPPGAAPALFLATALAERDTAWTPDGKQLFYSIYERQRGAILSRSEGLEGWSAPEFAGFSGEYSDLEPFITHDGAWLYFVSKRPLPGETEPGEWDIWRIPRTDDGWGDPEILPAPVNDEHKEFYPSLTTDGDLYFTSDRPGRSRRRGHLVGRVDRRGLGGTGQPRCSGQLSRPRVQLAHRARRIVAHLRLGS